MAKQPSSIAWNAAFLIGSPGRQLTKGDEQGLVQHGRQQHEKSKPLLEIRAFYKSILIIITKLTGQVIHCAVLIPLIVAKYIIGSVNIFFAINRSCRPVSVSIICHEIVFAGNQE